MLDGVAAGGDNSAVELTLSSRTAFDAAVALGAYVHKTPDIALDQARAADGAARAGWLHGIPMAVKDLMAATGFPAPTFAVTTGTLPSGLGLDPTTGVISGTPAAATGGETTVTIRQQPEGTPKTEGDATVVVKYAKKIGFCCDK